MDVRDQRRASLVPGVARAFRSPDFRTSFGKIVDGVHHQRLVVVLADDTMGYVFDRLDDMGEGIMVMPVGEYLNAVAFVQATPARMQVAIEEDCLAKVHRDVSVEMFFAYLRRAHGVVVIEQVSARLLADAVPVPC